MCCLRDLKGILFLCLSLGHLELQLGPRRHHRAMAFVHALSVAPVSHEVGLSCPSSVRDEAKGSSPKSRHPERIPHSSSVSKKDERGASFLWKGSGPYSLLEATRGSWHYY